MYTCHIEPGLDLFLVSCQLAGPSISTVHNSISTNLAVRAVHNQKQYVLIHGYLELSTRSIDNATRNAPLTAPCTTDKIYPMQYPTPVVRPLSRWWLSSHLAFKLEVKDLHKYLTPFCPVGFDLHPCHQKNPVCSPWSPSRNEASSARLSNGIILQHLK